VVAPLKIKELQRCDSFFVPLPKRLYGGLGLRVKPRVKPCSAMGTGVLMFCVTNPKHSQMVSIL